MKSGSCHLRARHCIWALWEVKVKVISKHINMSVHIHFTIVFNDYKQVGLLQVQKWLNSVATKTSKYTATNQSRHHWQLSQWQVQNMFLSRCLSTSTTTADFPDDKGDFSKTDKLDFYQDVLYTFSQAKHHCQTPHVHLHKLVSCSLSSSQLLFHSLRAPLTHSSGETLLKSMYFNVRLRLVAFQ